MSEIIKQYNSLVNWLEELKRVPEDYWLEPIHEGKWSIGEIIAHLKAWDVFVWDERFSRFLKKSDLPPKKGNVEEINRNAAHEARSGISKNALIDEVIECRLVLTRKLQEVPSAIWEEKIQMGNSFVTLCEYIKGMVEHDEHHKKQIEKSLLNKGIKLSKQEMLTSRK
ncbi:DinB family protein [Fictibacillus nanhaiensis]|uniref:DinB family protein n=1 Tax=Fictibacillus nanhaiensis TaxID=742169 RepID=UPI002E1F0483|nr:DinB family protein [Fictibacillus nanhaiensis]